MRAERRKSRQNVNELTTIQRQLPSTLPELSRFVLVGRDKLKAVKAEIHAIEKVGLAQEVREQKLHEAQEIAEVVTDAEVKIGELLKRIPKASGGDRKSNNFKISPHVDFDSVKPKAEVIRETGLTQRQAEHFQIMAENPDSVARAKERARQNSEVLSRSAVLEQVIRDCPKPKTAHREVMEAKERHNAFLEKKNSDQNVVSFRDIKSDAEDVKIIGTAYFSEIKSAVNKVATLALFKSGVDIESVIKSFKFQDRKQLSDEITEAIKVLQFLQKKIERFE